MAPESKQPGPAAGAEDREARGDGAAGEAVSGPGAAPANDCAQQLAAHEAERAELKDRWLRAEAELVNYRRRAARDLEEAEQRARERVLGEIVALADDLERALDAVEQAEARGPIHDGVRMVHERVRDILRSHGVEVIDPAGEPFDPHVAEALFQVDSPGSAPGTVVSVIGKGYRIGERLLRAAKVTVARAPAGDEPRGTPADRAEAGGGE